MGRQRCCEPSTALQRLALLATALWLPGACTPAPRTTCAEDQDCPAGYHCQAERGLCVRGERTGDAGGDHDAGAGADAGQVDAASSDASCGGDAAPPACGTAASYRDDFDDGAWPQAWLPCGAVRGAGGGLSFRLTRSGSGEDESDGCTTLYAVDMTEDRASVAITLPPDPNQPAGTEFRLTDGGADWLGFVLQQGQLRLDGEIDGEPVSSTTGPAAFDRDRHRYWQFRHHGLDVILETSSDRCSWTELASVPQPAWLRRTHLYLGGKILAGGAVDCSVRFDELNTDRAAAAPWCMAETLHDDFESVPDLLVWREDLYYRDLSMCVVGASGGEVSLTHLGSAYSSDISWCTLFSTSGYSLAGSAVSVEVTQLPAGDMCAGIALWELGGLYMFWCIGQNLLHAWAGDDRMVSSIFQAQPTPADDYSWLRIRQEGETTYFEASVNPPQQGWNLVWETRNIPPIDSTCLEFGIWFPAAEPADSWPQTSARFDNFNL